MIESISNNAAELGAAAADRIAGKLCRAIEENGTARLLLSTGASQFTTLESLVQKEVDWQKVTMFHLDEYIGLDKFHPASFRRYLQERFVSRVPLGRAVFVTEEGETPEQSIRRLTAAIREHPIDVGVIGIGQNAHIAFNDPPADFESRAAYFVVTLDDACKRQQMEEGWFETAELVPKQAVTMTPHQIMQCRCIVSPVPYKVKARAISLMKHATHTDRQIPATLLKEHPEFYLLLDKDSAGDACESQR